ncbi:uncharacterized protein M6B38_313745 [Iris pallida]|uniref:Uncharacterized protein n=1 Tax=Iris pallida TaxID=29817 RepID=A0AAX6HF94_IRIPA|nr:Uncharacterized protein M6B38_110860 [Iris pallida]KAJ6839709.1 uncharacterized protein M6B38_313745 [Iris pallida]
MPMKMSTAAAKADPAAGKPAAKSRLKRLFEKQFPKLAGGVAGDAPEPEQQPSTVCLDRLVLGFMEESNEKPSARCSRSRCNCFHGSCDDSSDDESFDDPPSLSAAGDAADIVKGLVPCESVAERNLLADAAKIVESAAKSKAANSKDDLIKVVAESLRGLGIDACACRSRWEKTPSIPAGEYSYIDVVAGPDRLILDIDFRSEFEIARPTKNYRSLLQSLPTVFVGKPDRLQRIVAVVSDAARVSLKKKGLHVPPWRKPEYMKAKWLSPSERLAPRPAPEAARGAVSAVNFSGEFEMRSEGSEKITVVVSPWKPPAVMPRSPRARAVTGLSSVFLAEKP